jgi:hypothetical protein
LAPISQISLKEKWRSVTGRFSLGRAVLLCHAVNYLTGVFVSMVEKSRIRKEIWKDLVIPDGDGTTPGGNRDEKAKKYQRVLDTYRAKASRFHKDLLKKKKTSSA